LAATLTGTATTGALSTDADRRQNNSASGNAFLLPPAGTHGVVAKWKKEREAAAYTQHLQRLSKEGGAIAGLRILTGDQISREK